MSATAEYDCDFIREKCEKAVDGCNDMIKKFQRDFIEPYYNFAHDIETFSWYRKLFYYMTTRSWVLVAISYSSLDEYVEYLYDDYASPHDDLAKKYSLSEALSHPFYRLNNSDEYLKLCEDEDTIIDILHMCNSGIQSITIDAKTYSMIKLYEILSEEDDDVEV